MDKIIYYTGIMENNSLMILLYYELPLPMIQVLLQVML